MKRYSAFALLAFSFSTLIASPSLSAVPDWFAKPPKLTISQQGGTTHIRSNYISKHYVRFYISDGSHLMTLRRFPSGRWEYREVTGENEAYIRSHHQEFIFSAQQRSFIVEVHGKTYKLEFKDGQWVETPIDSASSSSGGSSSSSSSGADIVDQDEDVVDNDHDGSNPLCNLMGTCGGTSNGGTTTSSSSSSSGSSSGVITPVDPGSVTSGNPNLPAATKTTEVNNCTALQAALNAAQSGEHVVADNTAYNCNLTMSKTGVVLRSKNLLGATLGGEVVISGSGNYLFGFKIHGPQTNVKLGGTGNKVLRNNFQGWPRFAITMVTGRGGEVGYNEFSNPCPWATCGGGDYPLRIAIRSAENSPSNFHFNAKVYRNYFHDFPTKPNPANYHSGQDDAIEVCQTLRPATAMLQTGWLIEYNLIQNHLQGHGVLDMKCGGNIVRFNTMVNVPGGRIDARNGHYNTVIANWLEGTGGMTIHGRGHRYIGNKVTGGGNISVMAADGEWNNVINQIKQRAYEVQMIGNIGTLKVGHAYAGDTIPAYNTRVEGHQGGVSLGVQTGTVVSNSTSVDVPQAVKLTPSQVGPNAGND